MMTESETSFFADRHTVTPEENLQALKILKLRSALKWKRIKRGFSLTGFGAFVLLVCDLVKLYGHAFTQWFTTTFAAAPAAATLPIGGDAFPGLPMGIMTIATSIIPATFCFWFLAMMMGFLFRGGR